MEGDAGTRQLNPTDAEKAPDDSVAVEDNQDNAAAEVSHEVSEQPVEVPESADAAAGDIDRRSSRLGRGWLVGICAGLLVLTVAAITGGYLAVREHQQSKTIARDDAAALQAAKDCVAATQAPDTAAMSASQLKIIECSTGDFGAQATLYSGVLVDAYQAANVKVQVSDMRAAVERHNGDGSVDVLVAVRVKVTNSEAADQEQGYRLRVKMAADEGKFKIAKLDQVTS
jgi:Mce-associated membrane protein